MKPRLSRSDPTFIRRVVLTNYKSIASADVRLERLTFLVGPNGSGKSNFVDALRFVAEALRTSLDHALRERGGIKEVRRRPAGRPTHFGIRLDFTLPSGQAGHYAFRIGAKPKGGYEVQEEECQVDAGGHAPGGSFRVLSGSARSTARVAPAAAPDRLYLVNASGLPEFRPVYEALSTMGFYNLNPDRIRDLQPSDPGALLMRDGGNLASVFARMSSRSARTKAHIEEYLGKVVPGLAGVDTRALGPKETLEFRQAATESQEPWRFLAANMSDGTLRAFGILVAIFQGSDDTGQDVSLVAIEEPEVALHPAAAGVVLDSLRDASRSTQILVTSHSPDLLDDEDLAVESILAVTAEGGTSNIGPLDEAGRAILRDRLYTPGELLRLNQLTPAPASERRGDSQPALFDEADT